MTPPISSEQVIRMLYQITNDHKKALEHQVTNLLQMGLECFGLDIGILSKIEQGEYLIEYCVTPEAVPMQRYGSHLITVLNWKRGEFLKYVEDAFSLKVAFNFSA